MTYKLRLRTSNARGAALSDPNQGGVNVCLVGSDGRGVLHNIPAWPALQVRVGVGASISDEEGNFHWLSMA